MPCAASSGRSSAQILLHRLQPHHFLADGGQLLGRRKPVDRIFGNVAAHLPGQPRHAHHQELVEIVARNRKEAQPFQQRIFLAPGLGQHALVEGQPRTFAVEEAAGMAASSVCCGSASVMRVLLGGGEWPALPVAMLQGHD
jgi:hypothetical protein